MKKHYLSFLFLLPILVSSLSSCAPNSYNKLKKYMTPNHWHTIVERKLMDNTTYEACLNIGDRDQYNISFCCTYITPDQNNFSIYNMSNLILDDETTYNEFKLNIFYFNAIDTNNSAYSNWEAITHNKHITETRCLDVWGGIFLEADKIKIANAISTLINDVVDYFYLYDLPQFID